MIGQIALNLSMILYLLLALFQLRHNLYGGKIDQLSLGVHALLLISATADLYYGFWFIQQWQYRVVSLVFLSFLIVQHLQLFCYHPYAKSLILLSCLVSLMVLGLFILPRQATISITMGWIERVGYWIYAFPQILKNKRSPTASASISLGFAIVGLLAATGDLISAFYFSWGSPATYGSIIAVIAQGYLLWQCYAQKTENKCCARS